jgi:soluble lytic murein transglycosylase-like protein
LQLRAALLAVAVALLTAAVLFAVAPYSWARDGAIASAAAVDVVALSRSVGWLYQLDPDLLLAIARAESGGDPRAVSPKGALGLMQLMPATALRLGVRNPFDPIDNMLGAARFIAELRRSPAATSDASLVLILAAYNAGPGAVEKYGGVPPYAETHQYLRRVLRDYLRTEGRAQAKFDAKRPTLRLRGGKVEVAEDPHRQLADLRRRRANALEAARIHRERGALAWTSMQP